MTLTVHASRTYEIRIERGILDRAGEAIRETLGGCRVMIVTDDTVDALYGARLAAALDAAGIEHGKFVIPHGEASKNWTSLGALLERMAELRLTRADAVCALGGGVVGDLAGFAAAVYLRGVRYVGIPTTLLSSVDSSVGGKTAVDLCAGKNLAGAFWQPSLVLCDPETLSTLPSEILADGFAEVIKYGVIADAPLLALLGDPAELSMETVIARCAAAKARFVEEDEGDRGVRKLLNFGHTAGHAIEACSHYTVLHGHGVAAGMMIAARSAAKRGVCPSSLPDELAALLTKYGLPTESAYPPGALCEAALGDKKREGGEIDLILPHAMGDCRIHRIPVAELYGFFEEGCLCD